MQKINLSQIPNLYQKLKEFTNYLEQNNASAAADLLSEKSKNTSYISKRLEKINGLSKFPIGYLDSLDIAYEQKGNTILYYPDINLFINGEASNYFVILTARSQDSGPIEMILNGIDQY